MQPNKPSKRWDLQGIRGLAIIVVLGFHFYPNIFPNGYLGVDQFFVLSGFLMCMLLKRGGGGGDNMQSCSLITLFYSKRFKRILPLYLLIILLSLLSLYTIFPDTAIGTNKSSAQKALLFISNRATTEQENYFKMLKLAEDMFTHTWSLSIEIQFYILIPIFHCLIRRFSINTTIFIYSIVASCSFILNLLSTPSVAFNSVFCRIWQFTIGIIAYLLSIGCCVSDGDMECQHSLPVEIDKSMYSHKFTGSSIPSDGSCKIQPYISQSSRSRTMLTVVLMAPIFYPAVLPTDITRWYLKATDKTNICLIIILFMTNILIIKKDSISFLLSGGIGDNNMFDPVTSYMNIDDAELLNKIWNDNDQLHLSNPDCVPFERTFRHKGPGSQLCYHKGLNSTGKYHIALFGNSWAQNHARIVHQECGHVANSIFQGSMSVCEPLYPTKSEITGEECKTGIDLFVDWLEFYKPDVAFMISRFFSIGDPMPVNVTNMADDPIYQTMREQLWKLLKNIKYKLYILDAIPRANPEELSKLVEYKMSGKSDIEIDNKIVDLNNYEMARKRYKYLFDECGDKCIQIDYINEFYNNQTNTFRFYDQRGFEYFNIINHLTFHGLDKIRHFYTDICSQL